MSYDRFPQAAQMAHESMVRNLRNQAVAIWPQEAPLYDRYGLPTGARILDVGCGTGEIAARLARRYPSARIIGVDLLEQHLAVARERYPRQAKQLEFRHGDAYTLDFPDDRFDLTVCRHLLQSIPEPAAVVAELTRVTRPGGWLHLLVEDYGMIHAPCTATNIDRLWHAGVLPYGEATSTDLRIGRHIYAILRGEAVTDIAIDYVTVDTRRVSREAFAGIVAAWRDGYAPAIARHSGLRVAEVGDLFDALVAAIRDPDSYVVWQVPVASARKAGRRR